MIVDKYILGHEVSFTMAGITWSLTLLLMATVVTALRRVVEHSLTFGEIVTFLAYQIPRMFLFALPMAVLFGTLQTFTELSKHGEFIAVSAGGVSLPRMMRAPVIWGVALTIAAFVLQEMVVPHTELKKDSMLVRHLVEGMARQKNFRYEDPPSGRGPLQRLIQADRFDFTTNTLFRPRVQLYNDDHQMFFQISAERAQWKGGQWKFYLGRTVRLSEKQGGVMSAKFQEVEMNLPTPQFLRKTVSRFQQNMNEGDFLMVPLPDVLRYRATLRAQLAATHDASDAASTQKLIHIATYGIHDKIATPLICLALVLVGAPLGVRPPRATSSFAAGLSLVVLVTYYIVWSWDSALGRGGVGNPLLMAYLPLLLTTIAGAILVWRKSI